MLSTRGVDLYGENNKNIYASPFFDLSRFYMPDSFKKFFEWSRYFFLTNNLISPVVNQLSRYPITELTYNTEDDNIRECYKIIYEDILNIQSTMVDIGLDYHAYGNAFVSLSLPFKRVLICPKCKARFDIRDVTYKFRLSKVSFEGACKDCNKLVCFIPKDEMVKLPKKMKIVRYYPGDIFIKYNAITGETQYQYQIPEKDRKKIRSGDKFFIENTPLHHLHAIARKAKIIFRDDRIFHFKRSNIAGADMEWGVPLILPALKKAFYLQILQRAQEAIAIQHIVPLTVLYPEANSSQNPYEILNLSRWKKQLEKSIKSWKKDPNHIGIMPFPVGIKPLFGEGRRLLVTPEVKEASLQVVAAMGVPQEFLFGGMSWSASSINLRMLENQFINYRTLMDKFLVFTRNQISRFLKLPKIRLGLKEFKMIDDVQQKQLIFQLNQANKVSDETLLDYMGKDAKEEVDEMYAEWQKKFEKQRIQLLEQEKLNGEILVMQQENQVKAQQAVQDMMQQQQSANRPPQVDLVGQYADELTQQSPERQQQIIQQMRQQQPEMAEQILARTQQQMDQQTNAGSTKQQQPKKQNNPSGSMPEQRAPRGQNRLV